MLVDPFLYVALAAGYLLGRVEKRRTVWIGRATLATIVILVFLLGSTFHQDSESALLGAILPSLGLAVLVLGLTAGVYLLLLRWLPSAPAAYLAAPSEGPGAVSLLLLGALIGGGLAGYTLPSSLGGAVSWVLYLMLFLVGFEIELQVSAVRRAWRPLVAALVGALAAALLFVFATGQPLSVSLATTFAFGWYTLSGPLVAARAGVALGLLAFLTNFFRENLTMLTAPWAGRRMRGEGLTAMGGATSMDTTLWFVVRYGDPEAGGLALTSGLVLSVLASLLLPLLLALPNGVIK